MLCMVKRRKNWEKILMSDFWVTKDTIYYGYQCKAMSQKILENDLVAIRKSYINN